MRWPKTANGGKGLAPLEYLPDGSFLRGLVQATLRGAEEPK